MNRLIDGLYGKWNWITEPMKTETRTIIVTLSDNTELRIVIPATSRLTFGPTIPYGKKEGYVDRTIGYSLRVYSGKGADTLIACYCDVKQFRDLIIETSKVVIRESGKTVWKSDESGYTVEQNVEREKSLQTLNLLK